MKSQLLHRKPMKARFKLPINSETAVQYLTAAISAEVEYRNHTFRNGDELHKQVASVAHWLCGMSGKNSLLLAGGCGNGKTTFVYAMQNLVNHFDIKNQVTGLNFGISLYNAKEWQAHRRPLKRDNRDCPFPEWLIQRLRSNSCS